MFPNGLPADDCDYRNQNLSYTAQLEFGIRWFDIDLCWVKDEEATPAVSAGLWTCHNDAYAGRVDEILRQVHEWMVTSPGAGDMVSFYFNGNFNRSRSEPIARALSDLLESHFPTISSRRKRGRSSLAMNTDFNTTGQWPELLMASLRNQRVFVFLHESLQLGDQPWAHDPVPSQSPREVVKDSCDGLIDFSREACNVCTDLWGIDAIGSHGNCIFETADICNTITYNITRDCLDLRMEYGRTVNVIEVDFPTRAPQGLSVVDIAHKFNDRNVELFLRSSPVDPPENVTNCTPECTPAPPPSLRPRPSTYCEALNQIAEVPLYGIQCSPNKACDTLICPTDLFPDGASYRMEISVRKECDRAAVFVIELFTPLGGLAGRVKANETGIYTLPVFPLIVTIDEMEDAVGVEVSI